MTVQELIDKLSTIEGKDEIQVILQKDAEGNGYSPLAGVDIGHYESENTWSGQVYHLDDPEAPTENCEYCLVLYPVN